MFLPSHTTASQASLVVNWPEAPQVNVRLPSNPALHVYTMLLPNASVAPSLPLSSVSASLRAMFLPSHTTVVEVLVLVELVVDVDVDVEVVVVVVTAPPQSITPLKVPIGFPENRKFSPPSIFFNLLKAPHGMPEQQLSPPPKRGGRIGALRRTCRGTTITLRSCIPTTRTHARSQHARTQHRSGTLVHVYSTDGRTDARTQHIAYHVMQTLYDLGRIRCNATGGGGRGVKTSMDGVQRCYVPHEPRWLGFKSPQFSWIPPVHVRRRQGGKRPMHVCV